MPCPLLSQPNHAPVPMFSRTIWYCQLPSKTFGKATVRLVGEQGPTKKLVWTPACRSELIQPRKQNSTAAKIYVLAGGYLSSSLRRCHRTTETDNSLCAKQQAHGEIHLCRMPQRKHTVNVCRVFCYLSNWVPVKFLMVESTHPDSNS